MAILPNELLSEICSHADIRTLKQLRLVNRTFSAFAAEHLFREIQLISLPESIENVRKIVEHPVLCLHVKAMIYLCSRLNHAFLDLETWKASAIRMSTVDFLAEEQDSLLGWHQFGRMFSDQSCLIKQEAELDLFNKALRALPSLETIEHLDFTWSKTYGKTHIYDRIAKQCLLPARKAFLESTASIPFDPCYSSHVALLKALRSCQNNRVRTLIMSDIPWITCEDPHSFKFYHAVEFLAGASFANLRSLCLEFWVYLSPMPTTEYQSNKVSLFCKLLSHAPLLEELGLHPVQLYSSDGLTAVGHVSVEEIHTNFTSVLRHLTWPNLRELSLDSCVININAFIRFMKRHASTLDDLELINVKLKDCPPDGATPGKLPRQSMDKFPSAWEWAIFRLAPVMAISDCCLKKMTDDELVNRISQGDKNGISVEWLVRSWRMELALYFNFWDELGPDRPYFPVYGEPRVIEYEDETEIDDEDEDDD